MVPQLLLPLDLAVQRTGVEMVAVAPVRLGAVHRLVGGVERYGISNWITFLENTEAYRRDNRRAEYGDERDPKMRAVLQRVSPITNVDRIKKPMLVMQGANDPRVPLPAPGNTTGPTAPGPWFPGAAGARPS